MQRESFPSMVAIIIIVTINKSSILSPASLSLITLSLPLTLRLLQTYPAVHTHNSLSWASVHAVLVAWATETSPPVCTHLYTPYTCTHHILVHTQNPSIIWTTPGLLSSFSLNITFCGKVPLCPKASVSQGLPFVFPILIVLSDLFSQ